MALNTRSAGLLCSTALLLSFQNPGAPELPEYVPNQVRPPRNARYLDREVVTIVGYNDMQAIFANLNELFVRTHPGIKFKMELKGTAAAPAALAFGISAFAPMGAEFSALERVNFRSITGTDPIAFRVAHCSLDPLAKSAPIGIFVNRANPLQQLTTQQVSSIFTTGQPGGDITSWGQLGLTGESSRRSIHPSGIGEEAAGGLAAFMLSKMGGLPFAAEFDSFAQSTEVVNRVAEDINGIGFASGNIVNSRVKCLAIAETDKLYQQVDAQSISEGTYPYDRHLLIYARQNPGEKLDPFVREYLRLIYSREGQNAIARAAPHYLPLNSQEVTEELRKLRELPDEGASQSLKDSSGLSIHTMGAAGLRPVMEKMNARFAKLHAGISFQTSFNGSSAALDGLTAGLAAFAVLDREAWPLELRPFRQLHGYAPLDIHVARVGCTSPLSQSPPAVFVNARNPLPGLTVAQVAQIFVSGTIQGDVKHWSQLGLTGEWAERGIHVYGPRDDGEFATGMRYQYLGGLPFTRHYEPLSTANRILEAVAADPYGIALSGPFCSRDLSHDVRMMPLAGSAAGAYSAGNYQDVAEGKYPLSPYLHLYLDQAPGRSLDPLVDEYIHLALSPEGQKIISNEPHTDACVVPLAVSEIARELSKVQ